MSGKLIIAAAGSGKTTRLVEEALKVKNERILLTTFTEANETEIKKKFFEKGCIPENVTVQTWFSFLLKHGVKPYQGVIYDKRVNGLLLVNKKSGLKYQGKFPVYYGEKELPNYYFTQNMKIYSDKISKFVYSVNEKSNGLIISRLSRIYQHIFMDEVQDFAGYDLELIKLFLYSPLNILMVGDPRQTTYHTHLEDKYKKYRDGRIDLFLKDECREDTYTIDPDSLNKTYRNDRKICDLANQIFPEFPACGCKEHDLSGHDGVFLIQDKDVNIYLERFKPMQLRDKVTVKVNATYPVMNFGNSKGLTFQRTLLYPTQRMIQWLCDHSTFLPHKSRAKLYVALTRAKYSVGIVVKGNIDRFAYTEIPVFEP